MEPSTKPPFAAPRRVMTAPLAATSSLPSTSSQSTSGLVETLYNHPNVKIISFSASGRGRARSPGRAQPEEEPGSLSSSSGLERTIAVGPFRIYRAPGSVAFLNCGSALQPILPKSQCWCIDEISNKFVLQIRRPNYWRIEIPVESPHEQDLALALRVVFDQILQFEKTPCPFKRSFTVRLPERPTTPVIKKPWAPVQGPLPPLSTPEFETSPTPRPKSLRSAEKKSVARRSSAALDRTPTKAASDSDQNASRDRSTSTTRSSDAVVESPVEQTSDAKPEELTEEERGRTLARTADVVNGSAVEVSVPSAAEEVKASEKGQNEERNAPEEREPEVPVLQEKTPKQDAPEEEPSEERTLEEKTLEDQTPEDKTPEDETPEDKTLEVNTLEDNTLEHQTPRERELEAPGVLEEEGPEQKASEEETPSVETPEVKALEENIQQAAPSQPESIGNVDDEPTPEVEEPWSAHSIGTPNDVTEAEAVLGDEPWSAHSLEPTSFIARDSIQAASSEEAIPEATEPELESKITRDAVLDIAVERNPEEDIVVRTSPVSVEVDSKAESPAVEEATPKQDKTQRTDSFKPVNTSELGPETEKQPIFARGLETVSEESSAPAINYKRLSVRSDIFEGIRPYDQKSAAGTLTSLDVASRSLFDTEPIHVEVDDDKKSSSSHESALEPPEEQSLEASGEASVHEGSGTIGARRKKLRGFHGSRSLVVPPQLTLVTSPPSKSAAPKQVPRDLLDESNAVSSPTDSQDSFHSVQSWHSPITPLPPSPPVSDPTTPSTFPYPHNNILMPKRLSRYEMSDMTVTPETRRTWDAASTGTHDSSQESAATAPDIGTESLDKTIVPDNAATSTALVDQRSRVRHRATTSTVSVNRRTLSPLPPAANLFSPTATTSRRRQPRGRPLELVRRVPMAIVAKTCEILLSPPSHLINLMLRVAAKIAAGEWRGMVFGYGEGGETIPVHWDYSDGELSGDDDEYYMSHTEASRAGSVADRNELIDVTGRGWEVD